MKTVVSIQVPVINQKYDMLIPDFLPMTEVIPLVSEAVEEMSGKMYKSSGNEVLCFKEHNAVLSGTGTLKSLGVQTGDTLILI